MIVDAFILKEKLSVLTGEILAITANAIFEMPRKDGIYTMASYLEKYQVLDELKK